MPAAATQLPPATSTVDADAAWEAVCARSAAEDGAFVYAVRTTGVYCRPSCPARRPLRKNVTFFDLAREARNAGYRACKRCKPDDVSTAQKNALLVEAACRTIETAETPPSLAALAADAGMSAFHFHRVFKAHTGVTPKAYASSCRGRRIMTALKEGGPVTAAAFRAGFQELSRFYEVAANRFGMAPARMSSGGRGEVIVTVQQEIELGWLTVAFSRTGVVAIVLTDDSDAGRKDIAARFGHGLIVDGGEDFARFMEAVVAAIHEPSLAEELPLDIRGTAFEERVWAALRKIPVGSTATYSEVAEMIGSPTAHRAVARACGANPIAIAIPCHRVVRADGSLAGYRWGIARKEALLSAEAGANAAQVATHADA